MMRSWIASGRPVAAHMVMGHARAVGGVQRFEVDFLGVPLEVPVESRHESSAPHSPTDKEEPLQHIRTS